MDNGAESSRFQDEDNIQRLVGDDELSQPYITTNPMSYDDAIIESQKPLIQQLPEQKPSDAGSSYGILKLPRKFAEEIHDLIDVERAT